MSRSGKPPKRAPGTQLPLSFPLQARCVFENFDTGANAGANAELVRHLVALVETAGFQGCFLSGSAGTGRTHLLQAACHRCGGPGGAVYLPLRDVKPALLDGLDSRGLVALDDLDAWVGDAEAEAALLGLYQGLLARGGRLLVSAAAPARQLDFHFADLASRLRGLPAYTVHGLDDAGKARVLARLAAARGLTLSSAVLDFWLSRSGREMSALLDQFERLDRAAMAAQRRVTVPLVKDVLGL